MIVLEAFGGFGPLGLVIRLVGFAILAAGSAGLVAFVYRSRIEENLPESAALIVGLGTVAIYLNTRIVLIQFVGNVGDPLSAEMALTNVAIFSVAGLAAIVGQAVGHRVADDEYFSWAGGKASLSPIVRASGRFISVTIPKEIRDIEGYDPVSPETKEELAGRSFDFPRGLTVDELEEQLTVHLSEKHDIGYVDLDVGENGEIEYLAAGRGPAGLGGTLPPGMAAVAVRADPAFSASPGDTIKIWRDGEDPEPVGIGELRAAVDDVVTVACDRAVATEIDPTVRYRLVTHAAGAFPEREFTRMLRHGAETMSILEIGPDTPLVGSSIAGLDLTVLAIQRGEEVMTIPGPEEVIESRDRLYLLGRPDRLRAVESVVGGSPFTDDGSFPAHEHQTVRPGGGIGTARDGR